MLRSSSESEDDDDEEEEEEDDEDYDDDDGIQWLLCRSAHALEGAHYPQL